MAEGQWHPIQDVTKGPDGEVEITFESDWFEQLSSWALSFGEMAEVLEPPELRDMAKERMEKALRQYNGCERRVASHCCGLSAGSSSLRKIGQTVSSSLRANDRGTTLLIQVSLERLRILFPYQ